MLTESFVPKILGECYKASRTGLLSLMSGSVIKIIHFDAGDIVFATSSLPEERLSERLVEWGILNEEGYRKASELMAQRGLLFGKLLVEMNYLCEEELKRLVIRQVSEIVYSTFTWQTPKAVFAPCQLPDYEFKLSMPTAQTLLEGIRRLEDLTLVRSMIGELESPLRFVNDPRLLYQAVCLQPQEAFLVSCLENTNYTAEELIKIGAVPEPVVLKTVCALLQAGILTTAAPAQESLLLPLTIGDEKPESDFDTRAAMEFCYEVESKMRAINSGASHYQILEVSCHAGPQELKDSYARLAKHFHPDRQAQLADYHLNLHAELESIFSRLTEAIQVLHDPDTRGEYHKEVSLLFKRATPAQPPTAASGTQESLLPGNNSAKISQKAAMEFCYQVESKLREIEGGATHYQALELDRDATREMIEEAYRRLSEQFDIKRQMELSPYGLDISGQLEEILAALRKASEALRNSYQKKRYDEELSRRLRRARAALQAAPPQLDESSAPILPVSKAPASPTPVDIILPEGKSPELLAAELYMRSLELYNEQRFEQAIKLLHKAAELSPNDPEYWAQIGRTYSKIPGKQREAESAYREAIRLAPNDADYPTEIGLTYQKYGLYKKALEMFQEALRIDPMHMMAKRALASVPQSENRGRTGEGVLNKLSLFKKN